MAMGLGYALAGAVYGLGEGLVAEAQAKREAALVQIRRQWQQQDQATARSQEVEDRELRYERDQANRAEDRSFKLEDEARGLGRKAEKTEKAANVYASLYGSESGGRLGAENDAMGAGGQRGHFGRSQFGKAKLDEYATATGRGRISGEDFKKNPQLQGDVEQWHFSDINSFIDKQGLTKYEGQRIKGVEITRSGMIAMAHLGGKDGLRKFLETNGTYDPADKNGTRLSDYAKQHGGLSTDMSQVWNVIADPDTPATVRDDLRRGLGVGSEKPSATEEKIALLMEGGLDRTTAAHIATGRYVVSRDPFNGQSEILDKATGQRVGAMPETVGRSAESSAAPDAANGGGQPSPPGERLYDRAGAATGVVPELKELSTDTLGQLPAAVGRIFQFPETVEDRQAFRTAAGNMFRALSVNPKMPVAEINRIREQISIEPRMFRSEEGLRARMRSIDATLREHIVAQRELAEDPSMPASARKDAATNAAAMEAFIAEMGVPRGGGGGAAPPLDLEAYPQEFRDLPVVNGDADYEDLPSGAMFIAPDGSVRRKP